MYNKHTLRKVKEDFDWQGYIENNFDLKYAKGANGTELRVCCPSCLESKYKCYINPDKGVFKCFKCRFSSASDDVFSFVAVTEGITKGQALIRLFMNYKPLAPEDGEVPYGDVEEEEVDYPQIRSIEALPLEALKIKMIEGNDYWEYLESRGFTEKDILATNVHYVPQRSCPVHTEQGIYKGDIGRRILFPVYGPDAVLVGWQGRTIKSGSSDVKYLNCPDSDISSTLWPFSTPYGNTAILVEGIIDSLSVRRLPKTSAYATFTKRISPNQIQILKGWGITRVVLWYDTKDALGEMVSAAEKLKMHFEDVLVPSLDGWDKSQDAGDLLRIPNGSAMIEEVLAKLISVYSMEYERWKTTF